MVVLLVIVCAGIMLYGAFLMARLDRFLAKGGFSGMPEISMEKDILLYGAQDFVDQICLELDQAAVTYDKTSEPAVQERTLYHWIGAFSDDDADNLLLCLSARRENGQIRTMARCNDMAYESIFKQMGITVILHKEVSAHLVLASLRG